MSEQLAEPAAFLHQPTAESSEMARHISAQRLYFAGLVTSALPQAIREMAVRGSTGIRLVTRSIPDWRSYWHSACHSVPVSQAGCNGRVTSPRLLLLLLLLLLCSVAPWLACSSVAYLTDLLISIGKRLLLLHALDKPCCHHGLLIAARQQAISCMCRAGSSWTG